MAEKRGADVLVYVNDGSNDVLVGGQKNATVSLSADTIESTTKSDDYKKYVSSYKSWSVSMDALVIASDSGFALLKTAYESGDPVKVHVKSSEATPEFEFEGEAIVTSLELNAPDTDLFTVSVELQGTGAPTTFNM